MDECKSGASKQLCPREQKHLFACVQLHSASPDPGAKTNFARNIATHSTFAELTKRPQSARIGGQRQIKAAVLQDKYCGAEWSLSHYFQWVQGETVAKKKQIFQARDSLKV